MKNLVTFVAAISLIMGSYSVFPADHFDAETVGQKAAETLTYKKVEVDAKESSLTDHRFIKEEEKNCLPDLYRLKQKGSRLKGKLRLLT